MNDTMLTIDAVPAFPTNGGTVVQNNLIGYWVDGVWHPVGNIDYSPFWPTTYVAPCTCHASFCVKCFMDAMEKLKGTLLVATTPATTKTLADTLLAQARARLDEIQKRLDEVSALEAEKVRLLKIIEAGG